MWQWLDELWKRIDGSGAPEKRRLLHRGFHLSRQVVMWLQRPECTDVQRLAFAELILKLDSDPPSHSFPILQSNAPPGMRWAPFDAHKAILIWDTTKDEIHFLTCV